MALALTGVALSGHLFPGDIVVARHVQDTPAGRQLNAVAEVLALRYVEYAALAAAAVGALRAGDRRLAAVALLALAATGLNPLLKDLVEQGFRISSEVIDDIVLSDTPAGE